MTGTRLRKILVAVADPAVRSSKAVMRAAQLAHQHGARLELFTCIASGTVITNVVGLEAEHWLEGLAAQAGQDLERLARRWRREELLVETVVRTAPVAHEAILDRARATAADLIVIEARRHGRVARLLLGQTDLELVRHTTVPLLIVKSAREHRVLHVLAAIDPFHANDKPLDLDARIVALANEFAAPVGGTVHLAHVYRPLVDFFPMAGMEPAIVTATPAQQRAYRQEIERRFASAASRFGVERRRRHLRCGEPAAELPRLARSVHAGLVVMGAVSRSAVKRVFIGSTAERVLDALACDVLIAKPRSVR